MKSSIESCGNSAPAVLTQSLLTRHQILSKYWGYSNLKQYAFRVTWPNPAPLRAIPMALFSYLCLWKAAVMATIGGTYIRPYPIPERVWPTY